MPTGRRTGSSPDDGRKGNRQSAAEMIGGIEVLAGEAVSLAAHATADVSGNRFAAYRRFRLKYDDYRALVQLIEMRLEGLQGDRAERLREEFSRLDAFMLTLLSRTAVEFFARMLGAAEIPLGAREVFQPEIDLLTETRLRLLQPGYAHRVDAKLPGLLDNAMRDVATVMARVPELPDFSQSRRPAALPRS